MNITSVFTAIALVWKLWPIVRETIPKILTAAEHVALTCQPPKPVESMNAEEKEAWDDERKAHVKTAVRAFVNKETVTDSQLNWAIETVWQITWFFPAKAKKVKA